MAIPVELRYTRDHEWVLMENAKAEPAQVDKGESPVPNDLGMQYQVAYFYLPGGFPSMYAYCVEELRLCEQAAYKRILVARTARKSRRSSRR